MIGKIHYINQRHMNCLLRNLLECTQQNIGAAHSNIIVCKTRLKIVRQHLHLYTIWKFLHDSFDFCEMLDTFSKTLAIEVSRDFRE